MSAGQFGIFQAERQAAAVCRIGEEFTALIAVSPQPGAQAGVEAAAAQELTRELQETYAPQRTPLPAAAPFEAPGFLPPSGDAESTALVTACCAVCVTTQLRMNQLTREQARRAAQPTARPDGLKQLCDDYEQAGPLTSVHAAIFQAHLRDLETASTARRPTLHDLSCLLGQRLRDSGCSEAEITQILAAGLSLLQHHDVTGKNLNALAAGIAAWLTSPTGLIERPAMTSMSAAWSQITHQARAEFAQAEVEGLAPPTPATPWVR